MKDLWKEIKTMNHGWFAIVGTLYGILYSVNELIEFGATRNMFWWIIFWTAAFVLISIIWKLFKSRVIKPLFGRIPWKMVLLLAGLIYLAMYSFRVI